MNYLNQFQSKTNFISHSHFSPLLLQLPTSFVYFFHFILLVIIMSSSSSASSPSSSSSVSGLEFFECPTRQVRLGLTNHNQLKLGTLCILLPDLSSSTAPYDVAKFEGMETAIGTGKKVTMKMLFYKPSNTSDIDLAGRDSTSFASSAFSSDDDDEKVSSSSSSSRRKHVGVNFSDPFNTTWIPNKSWIGPFHNQIIFTGLVLHNLCISSDDHQIIMNHLASLNSSRTNAGASVAAFASSSSTAIVSTSAINAASVSVSGPIPVPISISAPAPAPAPPSIGLISTPS